MEIACQGKAPATLLSSPFFCGQERGVVRRSTYTDEQKGRETSEKEVYIQRINRGSGAADERASVQLQ
jgi:hypothetical protein